MAKQAKKTTQKQKVTANALTLQVIYYLRSKGFTVWRQNNGAVYDPNRKTFRTHAKTSMRGVPDVIGFSPLGGFIGCEIKVGNDRLSPAQEVFLKRLKIANNLAFVVRDFDEFKKEFEEIYKEEL
jgi:hypothetical protein